MPSGTSTEWQGPLWAWAPTPLIRRFYREAQRVVPRTYDTTLDATLSKQSWLRAVQRDFDRRLREAHIYVEGLDP
jgi:hypothetical protein